MLSLEEREELHNLVQRADALGRVRMIIEDVPVEEFLDTEQKQLALELLGKAAEEAAEALRRRRGELGLAEG